MHFVYGLAISEPSPLQVAFDASKTDSSKEFPRVPTPEKCTRLHEDWSLLITVQIRETTTNCLNIDEEKSPYQSGPGSPLIKPAQGERIWASSLSRERAELNSPEPLVATLIQQVHFLKIVPADNCRSSIT